MRQIGAQLQAGEVVVLRDAFRPEFAEMVHSELSAKQVPWVLNEEYFEDGYHHKHHNVYDKEHWSARLNMTLDVVCQRVQNPARLQAWRPRACPPAWVSWPSRVRSRANEATAARIW